MSLSVCLSVCLSVSLSVCLSLFVPVSLSLFCLSVCLSFCRSLSLSLSLSLSFYLSVSLCPMKIVMCQTFIFYIFQRSETPLDVPHLSEIGDLQLRRLATELNRMYTLALTYPSAKIDLIRGVTKLSREVDDAYYAAMSTSLPFPSQQSSFPITMPAHSLSSTPGVLRQSAVSLPSTPGLLQQVAVSLPSTPGLLQQTAVSLPTSGFLQQAAVSLPTSGLLQQAAVSLPTSGLLQQASLSTTAPTVQQPFQTVQQIEQGIQQALQVDTTGLVSQQGPLSDVSIVEHENSHMSHISHHSAMSDRSVIPNTQDPVVAASVGGSQAPTGPSGDDFDAPTPGTFTRILSGL